MRVLSADWVVPVEGVPIEDGAVAIGEDGRIAEVGTAAELGEGERFPESVILPGFVNAHTHLEYAVYAGFGDGLPFGPWIALHVERKGRIGFEEMTASARLGALECLRSGITTVGDCSFSGAAAAACADLGLGAIVYLEVFGTDESSPPERFERIREQAADAFSERVRLGVSPHAPYTCTLGLYEACAELRLPLATHLAESEAETEFLRTGTGTWQAFADMLVPPFGTTGIRALAEAGLLGPHVLAAHCVQADDEEIRLLAENGVAVAHCPRSNGYLGCGIAPLDGAARSGGPGLHRHGQPRVHSVVRHVRGDAHRDRRCAGTRAAARTRSALATLSSSRPSAAPARSASSATSARWQRESVRISPCCHSSARLWHSGKIPLRQRCSAARLSASSLLSSPARPATRKEGRHGSS